MASLCECRSVLCYKAGSGKKPKVVCLHGFSLFEMRPLVFGVLALCLVGCNDNLPEKQRTKSNQEGQLPRGDYGRDAATAMGSDPEDPQTQAQDTTPRDTENRVDGSRNPAAGAIAPSPTPNSPGDISGVGPGAVGTGANNATKQEADQRPTPEGVERPRVPRSQGKQEQGKT
jgi:hypothetical protein